MHLRSTAIGPGLNTEKRNPRLARVLERLESRIDWERRSRGDGSMKVDLEPIRRLLKRLGSPESRFRAVHVAGTKGKGSTASLVEVAVRSAGLKTGLFTSPHVEDWTERIRIDGEPVSQGLMAAALEEALAFADQDATWFDCLTAAALLLFAHQGVEMALVEVGLGGRLDSTNALPAGVAAVTNIDLEHTEILGTTREEIAFEKGSIAKAGGVLVCGVGAASDPARRVIEDLASEHGSRFVDVWAGESASLDQRNGAVARGILACLGECDPRLGPELLDDPAVVEAARLPGRLEFGGLGAAESGEVTIVLDGAHVASSLSAVLDELESRIDLAGLPVIVFGARPDKNVQGLVAELAGRARCVLAPAWGERVAEPASIVEFAREHGLEAELQPSVEVALERAVELARAAPNGWILATGSLHFLGHVRPRTRLS